MFVKELAKELDIVYFGGLAMKGAGYIEDPYEAASFVEMTQDFVDVVTTSGPATGLASPIERLKQIHSAIKEGGRLAVCSGVSVENITELAGMVDYFMVGSSIETKPLSGVIDKNKLSQLIMAHEDAMETEILSLLYDYEPTGGAEELHHAS